MSRFLTDADVWICVCYTRLNALAAERQLALSNAACDRLARQLELEDAYRQLDPAAAADAYLQQSHRKPQDRGQAVAATTPAADPKSRIHAGAMAAGAAAGVADQQSGAAARQGA